jgi:hypothetical protein
MSNAGEGTSDTHRMNLAARGMLPFTATEKDCVDADGGDAECIICFEEYEAGDKMARLVCWCKFHKVRTDELGRAPRDKLTLQTEMHQGLVGEEGERSMSHASITRLKR